MTELRLALLGPPVVLRDGLAVTFDTRKAVALLALLAVTGREHSREQLADLLWPEADSAKGRASLRRTLSVTAAAMGAGLTISRAAVTLELAAVQVDVREFEALIARADAKSLEQAVHLYRDDFLSGFVLRGCPDFEEWQASVSEGLRQALARGLQRLVGARHRARPALAAARSAARARPSGDHQAARLGRPAFGGDAAVPLAGPGAGPGSGRSAAARDDPALRRCAGRAAGAAAGAFGGPGRGVAGR
jgi:DNA-binding SARP family transcriptional activator